MRRILVLLVPLVCPLLPGAQEASPATTIPPAPAASTEALSRAQTLAALAQAARTPASPPFRIIAELANCHATPAEQLPILTALLARADPGAQRYALHALARLGPAAAPVAPQLLPLIDPPRPASLRSEALAALVALPPTPPAVQPVLACLRDDRLGRTAQAAAAALLARWGPAASDALPSLAARVDDPDGLVAEQAVRAIGAIAPPTAPADLPAPGLPVATCVRALQRCLALQPPGAVAITALLATSEGDARHGVRLAAWRTLAQLGLLSRSEVEGFLGVAAGQDLPLAILACRALAGDGASYPGPSADPAVLTALGDALASAPAVAAAACAQGVARLGRRGAAAQSAAVAALPARATDALPLIVALLQAVRAGGPLPASQTSTIAALLRADAPIYQRRSHDESGFVQTLLLATLAQVGVPPEAHGAILDAIANPDPTFPLRTAAAARAAGRCGAAGAFAVPALAALLADPLGDALADLDVLPDRVAPHHGPARLAQGLEDSVRTQVLRALIDLGPTAADAATAVRALQRRTPAPPNGALVQRLAALDLAAGGVDDRSHAR